MVIPNPISFAQNSLRFITARVPDFSLGFLTGVTISAIITFFDPQVSLLIKHGLWPCVLLVFLFLFRKQIEGLISGIEKAESPWLAVMFSQKSIEKIEQESGVDPVESESSFDPAISKLWDATKDSPEQSMIDAWLLVYEKILTVSKANGFDSATPRPSTPLMVSHLRDKGLISVDAVDLIWNLYRTRNLIFKGLSSEHSPKAARRYLAACVSTIRILDAI